MKNIWSIICEKSSVDAQTNVLSLFNCIEEIKVEIDKTKMPQGDKVIIPINFQLISLWQIDKISGDVIETKLELVDSKGRILNESLNKIPVKAGEKRLRSIMNIQGLQVTDSGIYLFKILQKRGKKFELLAETPLDINVSYKLLDVKN